ncbi:MAG: LysR family transcriptional regulator [Tissierellia bacterium]|nr:LysR family transcriptional regulator [Tissierellia bacterium]
MDFRQLETFIEVADSKSFSRAAEKLYITQPTVTNHIQNLEKELGTLLINRSGKNISLTDAGELLYKYAINIVNYCEMAKFDLAEHKGRIQGHLSIFSSSVPRKYILPQIIKDFSIKYPNVSFSLLDRDSKNVVNSILDADTDFGIVGAMYPHNSLSYIELMEDQLVLIAPKNVYLKPNYSVLNLEEILDKKLIFREKGSGTRALLEEQLLVKNISTNNLSILAYIEDTETIKEFVSLGLGLSFVSKKAVNRDIGLGKFNAYYLKELSLNRKFYFVYHNKRQLSPLNETFKQFILSYVEKSSR